MNKVFKVTKVAEIIRERRKKSKDAKIQKTAEEANLYEKVNLLMTKGANTPPELIKETLSVVTDEFKRVQSYLQEKLKEANKLQ